MRIAYIAAGAADMYCGSCLHDNTLAAALLERGDDVILAPIYTPLKTDEANVCAPRVLFGGINVYLQQKSRLFRHTPWWLDRLFDSPALLRRVSRRASAVDASGLGDMTVSMARGELGNQKKEIEKLVHWLVHEVQPDVVHLSNALMLGMARTIAAKCGPPVVCSLSGEDIFLERIPQPARDEIRAVLRERTGDVRAFVALNRYYASAMTEYLGLRPEHVHVIPHGLNFAGHEPRGPRDNTAAAEVGPPQTIGYLARICHDKGLHLLIEACELLAAEPAVPSFRLHAAGYLGEGDRSYFEELVRRVKRGPLAGRFEYVGELDRAEKIRFLQSLDIFSTPTVYRESKGLPALEAMATGVPVVLPAHGSFPELIHDTGGGVLFEPHNARALADRLRELLADRQRAAELGRVGLEAMRGRYTAEHMAIRTRDLYGQLIERHSAAAS